MLYLVSTPIGNLQDITPRALETLRLADVIACEDTRHTRRLLTHFGITKKKLVSYHEFNERERARELIDQLQKGESVAVVSDAGTPAVSDPGVVLVRMAIDAGIRVSPVPGAVAFVAAVICSGLATDAVLYAGFLPAKKGDRRKRLADFCETPATLVFYEAPHRLAASLADCLEVLGDRSAVVARELTKLHEEFARGGLAELAARYAKEKPRGEVVLIIERAPPAGVPDSDPSEVTARFAELLALGTDRKTALKRVGNEFGLTRAAAYKILFQ